ncbi:hypothetical protein [Bacillus rhizoplanae]|uniref:hypothetical protein n=1 Tax=Bacillus rhizoplanae TaxID=2880966 RepID=UPI003D21649D
MKKILRPYFPNTFNNLVEKYFNEHYVMDGNNMENPVKYDGLNVRMYAGGITFWK